MTINLVIALQLYISCQAVIAYFLCRIIGHFNLPENSSQLLSKALMIGDIEIRNRAFLAPMSGVTDLPMRKLAWQYGAGLVVSEMVASEAFVEEHNQGHDEMLLKAQMDDTSVRMVQLAGREAKWMGEAAKIIEGQGADIIDINMGCPARRVTTGYSGSALMRDLDHAMTLVEATVNAVKCPVTLKMRLGWDHDTINAPELAKRAEDAGIHMITVHGRTRCQFYKGEADWNAVHAVRDAISLPLVVNGDIQSHADTELALQRSGADAVMIGRGAYGKPWLPAMIAGGVSERDAESLANNVDPIIEHHQAMLSFYGLESGIRQARKHLGWYLDNFNLPASSSHLKKKIMTSFDPEEINSTLNEITQFQQNTISTVAA